VCGAQRTGTRCLQTYRWRQLPPSPSSKNALLLGCQGPSLPFCYRTKRRFDCLPTGFGCSSSCTVFAQTGHLHWLHAVCPSMVPYRCQCVPPAVLALPPPCCAGDHRLPLLTKHTAGCMLHLACVVHVCQLCQPFFHCHADVGGYCHTADRAH
jgi:hypothetical protein